MLKFIEISNFEERIFYLKQALNDGLYIVPDIKSKNQFQNFLLKKKYFIGGECIIRASDFYCRLLSLTSSEHNFISLSQLKILFKNQPEEFFSDYDNILNILHAFLPFFSHPEGEELLKKWISQQGRKEKLLYWFKAAKSFWKSLNKHKMIEKSLAKYLLIDQPLTNFLPDVITVDLGFSIDAVEAEIFSHIASEKTVQILIPPSLNNDMYKDSHRIYSLIKEKSQNFQEEPPSPYENISYKTSHPQTLKFSSMMEEVRFITADIRKTLEKGISPNEITVLAPDIEIYWPCLKSYLKKEGLKTQKGESSSLLSFPQVQKWIHTLHFYSHSISVENIENVLSLNSSVFNVDQIKSKYFFSDRNKDIQDLKIPLLEKKDPESLITMDEFIEWSLKFWHLIIQKQSNPKLEQHFQSAMNKWCGIFLLKQNMKFKLKDLLESLKSDLAQTELHIQTENPEGIVFMSMNALTSLKAQRLYIIGLDDHSCQTAQSSFFSKKEADHILQDLGFHCLALDPCKIEYEIMHILDHFKGPVTLSFSERHFNETPLYPSKVWLLKDRSNKTQEVKPFQTVWGSIQKCRPFAILKNKSSNLSVEDLQISLNQNYKWPKKNCLPVLHLSASSLKNYASCPFIFLAQKIFHLEEPQYKDMDLNNLDHGRIIHDLFYKIKEGTIQNKKDILQWCDSIKNQFHILDLALWSIYEQNFLKKALAFMEHEKNLSQNTPDLKTVGLEVQFEGFWNQKKQKLEASGNILIQGRIDRIDKFHDTYLIIDYKASFNSTTTSLTSWTKAQDFQMPLYIQAVESSLINPPLEKNLSVSGAVYQNYKDFKYKGFISKESQLGKVLKNKTTFSEKKKTEILDEINKILENHISNIEAHNFNPEPQDKTKCQKCYWRHICRAAHLS